MHFVLVAGVIFNFVDLLIRIQVDEVFSLTFLASMKDLRKAR